MTAGDGDLAISGLSNLERIRRGGSAVVYRAWYPAEEMQVAIKVLDAVDEAGWRRYVREHKVLRKVSGHDHIVTLFWCGSLPTGDKNPYLVMEYLSGGSLHDRLEAGPMRWDEAIRAVVDVAEALGFSHDRGIFHQDVKPSNILVTAEGTVKLADYGIAALVDTTGTAERAWTYHYAAPECFDSVADEDDARDQRSDLYSLAATLFTLVTGRPPFDGSPSAVMWQHRHSPVPSTGFVPLDEFLTRAMAKDPTDRPGDAATFIAELEKARAAIGRTQDVRSRPPEPTVRLDPRTPHRPFRPGPPDTALTIRSPNGPPVGDTRPAIGRGPARLLAALVATILVIGVALAVNAGGSELPAVVLYDEHGAPDGDDSVHDVMQLTDGWLATSSADGTVHLWSPATDPPTTREPYTGHRQLAEETGRAADDAVFTLIGLHDGRLLIGGGLGVIQLWDPEAGDISQYSGHEGAVFAAVQLANRWVVSASADGTVQLWDPSLPDRTIHTYSGHRLADGKAAAIRALAALRDGRVATGGNDGTVQIWDPAARPTEAEDRFEGPGQVRAVLELDGGRVVAAGTQGVLIWDPTTRTTVPYQGHEGEVRALIQLTDGRVASAGADYTVQLWRPDRPDDTPVLYQGHSHRTNGLLQLADGRIASTSEDGTAKVWRPEIVWDQAQWPPCEA